MELDKSSKMTKSGKEDRSVKFDLPSEEMPSGDHHRNASLDPNLLVGMRDQDDLPPQLRNRSMTQVGMEDQQPVIFRRTSSFKANKRLSMKRRSTAVRKSARFSALNADSQVRRGSGVVALFVDGWEYVVFLFIVIDAFV